jgi:ubiquitin
MPVQNIPKHLRAKYERCVKHVKASGKKGVNPYAVCFSSVVGKGVGEEAKKRKGG